MVGASHGYRRAGSGVRRLRCDFFARIPLGVRAGGERREARGGRREKQCSYIDNDNQRNNRRISWRGYGENRLGLIPRRKAGLHQRDEPSKAGDWKGGGATWFAAVLLDGVECASARFDRRRRK